MYYDKRNMETHHLISHSDINDIRQIILNIFDEYNITHTEVYLNEYKKDNKR